MVQNYGITFARVDVYINFIGWEIDMIVELL